MHLENTALRPKKTVYVGRPELAGGIDENGLTGALVHAVYPGDERRALHGLIADADRLRLASHAAVADRDIVIAGSKKVPRAITHCNILVAVVLRNSA